MARNYANEVNLKSTCLVFLKESANTYKVQANQSPLRTVLMEKHQTLIGSEWRKGVDGSAEPDNVFGVKHASGQKHFTYVTVSVPGVARYWARQSENIFPKLFRGTGISPRLAGRLANLKESSWAMRVAIQYQTASDEITTQKDIITCAR